MLGRDVEASPVFVSGQSQSTYLVVRVGEEVPADGRPHEGQGADLHAAGEVDGDETGGRAQKGALGNGLGVAGDLSQGLCEGFLCASLLDQLLGLLCEVVEHLLVHAIEGRDGTGDGGFHQVFLLRNARLLELESSDALNLLDVKVLLLRVEGDARALGVGSTCTA